MGPLASWPSPPPPGPPKAPGVHCLLRDRGVEAGKGGGTPIASAWLAVGELAMKAVLPLTLPPSSKGGPGGREGKALLCGDGGGRGGAPTAAALPLRGRPPAPTSAGSTSGAGPAVGPAGDAERGRALASTDCCGDSSMGCWLYPEPCVKELLPVCRWGRCIRCMDQEHATHISLHLRHCMHM